MNAGHVSYQKRPPSERPVLYRCRDHAKSQNAAGFICHKITYYEDVIRPALRRFIVALAETPEFVAAAFAAYQQARRTGYTQEEHIQIINDLRELDKREAATAEAYARSIQMGTRPEVFEKLLTAIATERRQLEARKAACEAQIAERPDENPQEIAAIVASNARDMLEVLGSETLSSVEKNMALRRVVREIRPEDENSFRIETRPLLHVDIHEAPVTGIVMHVTATECRLEFYDRSEPQIQAA